MMIIVMIITFADDKSGGNMLKHATSAPAELGEQIHKISQHRARTQVPPQARKLARFRKWHVWCPLAVLNNFMCS